VKARTCQCSVGDLCDVPWHWVNSGPVDEYWPLSLTYDAEVICEMCDEVRAPYSLLIEHPAVWKFDVSAVWKFDVSGLLRAIRQHRERYHPDEEGV
jgi:hypothetical protein